jgi:hypothetical protein
MHGTIDGMSSSVAHALAIGRPTRNEFSIFIGDTPCEFVAHCPTIVRDRLYVWRPACREAAARDVLHASLCAQIFGAPRSLSSAFYKIPVTRIYFY